MEVKAGYKQTESGVIPEDWEVRQLSENFRIYAGGDVPKHSLSETQSASHPFPIFANALKNRGLYGYTNERRSKADSLTITARGYLGHAEYRDGPFFPIVRLLVLEPIGQLDAAFTTYAVNERVEFAMESTGVPQLTAPQVGKYSIAAPLTLAEQRAIAAALSDVDALLAGLDRLIAKKRDLKQAAMQQLLPGQTRLPGFSGEWEVKRLPSLATIARGQVDPRVPPYRSMYLIGPEHVEGGTGKLLTRRTALEQGAISGKYLFKKGDVVYGKINPYLKKAFLADFDGLCSADMYPLRPVDGVAPGFLLAIILGREFSAYSESVSVRSGMPKINRDEMEGFSTKVPKVFAEQAAIAAVLSDMDAELAALAARRDKTRDIQKAMMQELLTGKTRLVRAGTTHA